MAEFHFYSLTDEWWRLLESAIRAGGARFAIDRWYDQAQCKYYTSVTDEAQSLLTRRRVFLVGDYSRTGLVLEQQLTGPRAGQFAVRPSLGGPALSLTMPACIRENGQLKLSPGSLDFPRVYETVSGRTYAAPQEVLVAFKKTKDALKSELSRVVLSQAVWITPRAYDQVRAGNAIVRIRGKWAGVKSGGKPAP